MIANTENLSHEILKALQDVESEDDNIFKQAMENLLLHTTNPVLLGNLLTHWDSAVRGTTMDYIKDHTANENLLESLIDYFDTNVCYYSINGNNSDIEHDQILMVTTVAESIQSERLLEKFLAVPTKRVAKTAQQAVIARLDEAFIQRSLGNMLASEDPFVRKCGAEMVLNYDPNHVLPIDSKQKSVTVLVEMLDDQETYLYMYLSAAKILLHPNNKYDESNIYKRKACQILVDHLDGPFYGEDDYLDAINYLAPYANFPEVLRRMLELLQNEELIVIQSALYSIKSHATNPEVLPKLLDLCNHQDRFTVYSAIGTIKPHATHPEVLPKLLDLFHHKDPVIVDFAIDALAPHVTHPEVLPMLLELLQPHGDEDEYELDGENRLRIADVLIGAGVDSPEAQAIVLQALLRSNEDDLQLLEAVLGFNATEEQYSSVVDILPLDKITRNQIKILLGEERYLDTVVAFIRTIQEQNKPAINQPYKLISDWKIPLPLQKDLDALEKDLTGENTPEGNVSTEAWAAEWFLDARRKQISTQGVSPAIDTIAIDHLTR
jgi:hypothetical protein